jgi:homoserine O-acetyltransferase
MRAAATEWHKTVLEHKENICLLQGSETFLDEYANMDAEGGETHIVDEFILESGRQMEQVPVRYMTWGEKNEKGDNVMVVCHALTGNADAKSWWGTMIGPGRPLDTNKYYIFCANVLGSCYGTCGPTSINPSTGTAYSGNFPLVTVRDSVKLHAKALEALGATEIVSAIGGSMGGMQALEWTFQDVLPVRSAVGMACNGRHNPWQIGFSECQRQAIFADPSWKNGYYTQDNPPMIGLGVARQIAMVSYRTHNSYSTKFGRKLQSGADSVKIEDRTVGQKWEEGSIEGAYAMEKQNFEVESYLRYQGARFVTRRFDPNSYVILTHLMDSHDVSRGRGEYVEVLNSVQQPVMIIGIKSDVLYPVHEQHELRDYLGNAEFHLVESDEGHDGFLIEQKQIGPLVRFPRHRPSMPGGTSRTIAVGQ